MLNLSALDCDISQQLPIHTWVKWNKWCKVACPRVQHVGPGGAWTHNLEIVSLVLKPLHHHVLMVVHICHYFFSIHKPCTYFYFYNLLHLVIHSLEILKEKIIIRICILPLFFFGGGGEHCQLWIFPTKNTAYITQYRKTCFVSHTKTFWDKAP